MQKKTVTILPEEGLELLSKEYGNGVKTRLLSLNFVLNQTVKKNEKLEGGGRKPMDELKRKKLLEWIHGRGLRVSGILIMRKAKYLYDEHCNQSERDLFVASRGWLEKFMR